MTQTRQDGITLKQWLPLVGLTCCAFVFNTSEFMPIGLLTDIAASFSLTEAQAGIMISVYAGASCCCRCRSHGVRLAL